MLGHFTKQSQTNITIKPGITDETVQSLLLRRRRNTLSEEESLSKDGRVFQVRATPTGIEQAHHVYVKSL